MKMALYRLEPCAGKLARTVLGRARVGKQLLLIRQSVGNWYQLDLLSQWTDYARVHTPDLAWLGSGLVTFEGWLQQRADTSLCVDN